MPKCEIAKSEKLMNTNRTRRIRCHNCKKLVWNLDHNGYCSSCAAASLGNDIGGKLSKYLESYLLKFMPKWAVKIVLVILFVLILYLITHRH